MVLAVILTCLRNIATALRIYIARVTGIVKMCIGKNYYDEA